MMLHRFKKGIGAEETASEICGIYGDPAVTIQTVRTWFRRFRAGDFNLEDRECSGQPSTTDTDLIKALVDEKPRYAIREIAESLNIP